MRRRIRRLVESFNAAGSGMMICISNERNFRIHVTTVFYVLFFGLAGHVGALNFALLFICFAVVIGAEMFNTAIELMCDRDGYTFDARTKVIKDISAGAVLIGAFCSVIVGITVFANVKVVLCAHETLSAYPVALAALVLSVPLAIIFIKGKRN